MKAENKFRVLGCVALATLLCYAIMTGPETQDTLETNPAAIDLNIDGVEA